MDRNCSAAESPAVSATAMKRGRWDKAWKTRGHLVGPVGWTLDIAGHSHSPFLFLLADALSNDLLDFRIHDLVVAGWLYSLSKGKYKQNIVDMSWKDVMLMTKHNKREKKWTHEWKFIFCDAPPKSYLLSITHSLSEKRAESTTAVVSLNSCQVPQSIKTSKGSLTKTPAA